MRPSRPCPRPLLRAAAGRRKRPGARPAAHREILRQPRARPGPPVAQGPLRGHADRRAGPARRAGRGRPGSGQHQDGGRLQGLRRAALRMGERGQADVQRRRQPHRRRRAVPGQRPVRGQPRRRQPAPAGRAPCGRIHGRAGRPPQPDHAALAYLHDGPARPPGFGLCVCGELRLRSGHRGAAHGRPAAPEYGHRPGPRRAPPVARQGLAAGQCRRAAHRPVRRRRDHHGALPRSGHRAMAPV